MVSVPVSDPFDETFVDSPSNRPEYDGVVRIVFNSDAGGGNFSGTLLYTGRHILTAAHTITNLESVTGYSVQFSQNGSFTDIGVDAVYVHPNFDRSSILDNDIAILTLSDDAPIWADRHSLYAQENEVGQSFIKVGFGIAASGDNGITSSRDTTVRRVGENTYDTLAEAVRSEISNGTQLAYDFDNGKTDNDALGQALGIHHLGLGLREVSSSAADSGGPGFVNGYIAGITSSIDISRADVSDVIPGINSSFGEIVFDTRATAYLDYVEAIVGETNPDHALAPRVIVSNVDSNGISSDYYLAQNNDVKNAGIDAIVHYQANGHSEGRDPNPYFDTDGYLLIYSDVSQAGVDGLTHYMNYGWREGRDPSQWFDSSLYLDTYTDVADANINPLLHYLQSGAREGRDVFYSEDISWLITT